MECIAVVSARGSLPKPKPGRLGYDAEGETESNNIGLEEPEIEIDIYNRQRGQGNEGECEDPGLKERRMALDV